MRKMSLLTVEVWGKSDSGNFRDSSKKTQSEFDLDWSLSQHIFRVWDCLCWADMHYKNLSSRGWQAEIDQSNSEQMNQKLMSSWPAAEELSSPWNLAVLKKQACCSNVNQQYWPAADWRDKWWSNVTVSFIVNASLTFFLRLGYLTPS